MANAQVKPTPPSAPPAPRKSTLAEQSQVALTVYNSNIALVKEQRDIDLASGENTLQFSRCSRSDHSDHCTRQILK